MLQDFRRRTTPDTGARAARGAARARWRRPGVDAFLVPRADAHQGENVAPRDERLAWLTGFTGSAGLAVVTRDRAAIFVDGRYRLQVRGEVDLGRFEVAAPPRGQAGGLAGRGAAGRRPARLRPLAAHRQGDRDARRGARAAADRARRASRTSSTAAWPDQPPPPARPIVPHPVDARRAVVGREAGRARPRARRARPRRGGADAAQLDRLAPQRARLGHRPHAGAARLRDPRRRRPRRALHRPGQGRRADARPPRPGGDAWPRRRPSGRRSTRLRGRVAVDRATRAGLGRRPAARRPAPRWSGSATPASCRRRSKNAAELAGTRAAHLRDGAAVATFLAWLDADRARGRADRDRRGAPARGDPRRRRPLRDISFDTICGAGPNGAIVHYRVTEASNRRGRARASCCSSTAARSTPTAPPTSPAPSRSARRRRRRCGRSPWC